MRKKLVSGPALPGKLADCTQQVWSYRAVFGGGDSAGGSAKQARVIVSIRRFCRYAEKSLNTWKWLAIKCWAPHKEIHDIAVALGIDPILMIYPELRYGKVCILADADSDSLHIAYLLCALFLRHFPKLVEEGHVYVAMPPLYRIDLGKEVHYALDENEKERPFWNA